MSKISQILKKVLRLIITSKNLRKKILTFSLFLMIASFFWFLNQLNRDFKEQISLPIVYQNLPDSSIQILKLPQTALLTVGASGYALTEHYLSSKKSAFYIDLNKLKIKDSKRGFQYVLMKNVINTNDNEYTRNTEIKSYQPDTIKFRFEEIVYKKVPIKADVQFKLADNMITKKISCNPDSVLIWGATSVVDGISEVKTGKLDWGKLNLSKRKNIAIKQIDLVKFKRNRTNVSVEIEQLTENKLSIPIQHDLPLNYKLIPGMVNVSYKTGLSHFNQIGVEDFTIRIDVGNITDKNTTRKVELERMPSNIIDVDYSPHFVEIIEIKDE